MQLRLKLFVAAIAAGILVASGAMAATVTLTMDISGAPGTFNLYADSSPGDNAGIASYGIPLMGPILSLDHNSPKSAAALGPSGFGPAGFTSLRTADGNTTMLASQDTITPTPNLIYGFGQESSSFVGKGMNSFDPGTEGPIWNAHLLLASGTYNPAEGRPDFVAGSFDLFSNVFISQGSPNVTPAQLFLQCVGCEPPPPPFQVDDAFTRGYLPGRLVVQGPLPTNDSDDPDSLLWALESFGGPGGPIVDGSVDPLTGVFTWQSQATSPLGSYFATIRGTNPNEPIGTDTGILSFNLVPEPGTIASLAIGMVALMGMGRRRDG